MQHRPEEVARHTVEQNGGEYATDIPDLLSLFGHQQLTDAARQEIRQALQRAQVATDPDLLVAKGADSVRLFLLEVEQVRPARSGLSRLRPRTWKGWVAYAFAALLIVAALTPDSKDATEPKATTDAAQDGGAKAQAAEDAAAEATAERAQVRRERAQLRKQRARLVRERAQIRRQRARARRLAAARRERRQQLAAAEAAAAAQEPEPEPLAANCHPSYDPCLKPDASDYDCAGGSGDGPEYTGFVTVTGSDDYDLDSDGDGTGCES
jgi:hypothetical protein